MNLFQKNYKNVEPLAYKLRPKSLEDFVGQEKLLGKDGVITRLILNSTLSNSIFYGPPGCGKSSLGEIISNTLDCNFEKLNEARSKAFIHLFLKGMYGIEKFHDRESFITDGSYDGGIDAYYIDKETKEIIFIQSKFRTNENNFENKEITYDELLSMDINRIISGEITNERGNTYNTKISKMQEEINKIHDIGRYNYKIIILANLKEKTNVYLKKLTGGFPTDIFNFEKCYKQLVFPVISGCFFNAEEIRINLSLVHKDGNEGRIGYTVNTELSDCKILVTFIPLIEIAKILYKYKNSVLKYNPRGFLGLKNNQVNPQIADTVKNKSTNEFALFNNGITILSDYTEINSQVAKKDRAQLIIMNPQIINGGQTAFTLSSLYEECIQNNDFTMFDEKEVLVKIKKGCYKLTFGEW